MDNTIEESGESRLLRIAKALKDGAAVPSETVRTFLSWFGAQRRGAWVVVSIRSSMEVAGVVTRPDFEAAYIDSLITFHLKAEAAPEPPATSTSTVSLPAASASPSTPADSVSPVPDPSFRISKLAAANRVPVSVKPDAGVDEAATIMLTRDFSQLPVMTTEREVKGAISWRSIATRMVLKKTGTFVREVMDPVDIVAAESSLFDAIRLIVERGYVLVQASASDRRIVGIVTSSDLSLQFHALTEPFLLLSEIENDLRRVLQGKFCIDDFREAKDPGDAERTITSVHNMNFGEYIFLLQNPDKWLKLGLPLDRGEFTRQLREVGRIRNDVMHFDPDGIPPEDLGILRDFASFLARLRFLGAT